MRKQCSVCARKDRKSIDEMLAAGKTQAAICRVFGLRQSTLSRHAVHFRAALFRDADKPHDAGEPVHYKALRERYASRMAILEAATAYIIREGKKKGQHDVVLRAVAQQRQNYEADAKLSGALPGPQHQELHLHLDPERAREIAETFLARRREQLPDVPKSLPAARAAELPDASEGTPELKDGHCGEVISAEVTTEGTTNK